MFEIQRHSELTQVTTHEDITLGIMKWGTNNSFPQTLENLIKQSPSAYPAVNRTAKFLRGSGFKGEDEIINSSGMTLGQLHRIIAQDQATFRAHTIHCNYNLMGEVTSMTPMRISDLRFAKFDELNSANKIGYYFDFGQNSEVKKAVQSTVTKDKIKWFNIFNPDGVEVQIETSGGIGDYLGQLLYHSDEGVNSYPTPPLQPVINYVLSDIENSILVRKETSTGFISTYILKTSMDSEDTTLVALEDSIEEAQGARGTGKVIVMSGLAPEDVGATVLEEIGSGAGARSSVILSAKEAYELSRSVINGAYLIPPALAGIDQKTGLSGADLEEAYDVYNALTKDGRDALETSLNKILENSVFKTKSVSINKLTLSFEDVVAPSDGEKAETEGEVKKPKKVVSKEQMEAQANLRGSVGGVQGILSIQEAVASGTTSRSAAIAILGEIYGFEPDVAGSILGDVEDEDDEQKNN